MGLEDEIAALRVERDRLQADNATFLKAFECIESFTDAILWRLFSEAVNVKLEDEISALSVVKLERDGLRKQLAAFGPTMIAR